MTSLQVASLNVNGLRSHRTSVPKRRKIFTWIKKLSFDIIFLQETHSDKSCEQFWLNEWGGKGFFAHGTESSRGVAVLFKPNLPVQVSQVHADPDGRYLLMNIDFSGSKMTIGNMYGPNSDDVSTFQNFISALSTYSNELIILGGDWNFCMNPNIDRQSVSTAPRNHTKCKEIIQDFAEERNLLDIWREQHQSQSKFTCVRKNPPSKSRIDFFLVSSNFLYTKQGAQSEIRNGYLTDHSMVTIQIEIASVTRGRSYWKFNNSLLKQDEFVELMKTRIPTILEENDEPCVSRDILLRTLLSVIRGEIIAYSSNKKKVNMQALENFEKEIQILSDEANLTDAKAARLETIVAERDELITELTHRNMFQAKVRWRHLGERGTKYFHGLKKINYPPNVYKAFSLHHSTGKHTFSDNAAEMLKECHVFFSRMYDNERSPRLDRPDAFSADIPRLSSQKRAICEGILTTTELNTALFLLKNDTSPGPSGFTAEFYKCFWDELKGILLQALLEIQNSGKTKTSFKQSVTIMIPKRGKDQRYVENLRPISLLDVPYKIYTKAIARRIERVIETCIHEDQSGFIKGRFIGENIRLVLDLADYCTERKKSSLLLSCDFQKAYDSLDWGYLNKVIAKFGFGTDMQKLIASIYSNENDGHLPNAVVQLNGHLSEPYTISKGLRQGCPLSSFLFLLCVEPLLIKIRKADNIAGMKISDQEIKVAAYADDVTVILDGSASSLEACIQTFDEFANISGLHLNRQKTRPFWIGHNAHRKQSMCNELN